MNLKTKKTKTDLSSKTIWFVVWFVIFGGSSLCIVNYFEEEPIPEHGHDENVVAEDKPQLPSGPFPTAIPLENAIATNEEEKSKSEEKPNQIENLPKPHQEIEDPNGVALHHFRNAMERLSRGQREEPIRILHYGDSILTTDQLSGQVRKILQKEYGDGGHGFVLLGKPWRWYRHLGVNHGAKGKWRARPFTSDPLEDGLYGLGGVAFEAKYGSRGRVWVGTVKEGETGNQVSNFDLSYLQQPGGGSFVVRLDGKQIDVVSTNGDEKLAIHKDINVPLGAAQLEIEYNNDGPIRLFGAVLETGNPGIVYDSLAINGARASSLGRFDETHWISELKRRKPSLLVLMMGANEGANRYLALDKYATNLRKVIGTIKNGLPTTSVLVMGALDQAKKGKNGILVSKKMPEKLSKVQRKVALEMDCAFFDTWSAMGGRGSMGTWVKRGLGGGDYIHPTEWGARKIGNWLAQALLHSTNVGLAQNTKSNSGTKAVPGT